MFRILNDENITKFKYYNLDFIDASENNNYERFTGHQLVNKQ